MASETTGVIVKLRQQRADFTLDVDLQLPGSGISAIFGESGSGKTSILRCIAGLEPEVSGEVIVNGDVWQQPGKSLGAHQRPMAYVFQEASLFPHLNVQANLDYAIKRAPADRASQHAASYEQAVELFDLAPLLARSTHDLSGGERQRVAIARALLARPQLLLMDEPLASLDYRRKQEILPYLERLHLELMIPVLYVSHSADEVARLADHIVVLEAGKVVASGPLSETLAQLDFPINLGEDAGVVLDARVVELDKQWSLARVAFAGGELWVRDNALALAQLVRVRVLARDISLALTEQGEVSILNLLQGEIVAVAADKHPALALVGISVGNSSGNSAENSAFVARVTQRSVAALSLGVGKRVCLQIKSAALV